MAEEVKERRSVVRVPDILRGLPDPPRLSPALNRVIDEALHPLAEERPEIYAVDSLLHIAVEMGDALAKSLAKTLRYNVSRVLERMGG